MSAPTTTPRPADPGDPTAPVAFVRDALRWRGVIPGTAPGDLVHADGRS